MRSGRQRHKGTGDTEERKVMRRRRFEVEICVFCCPSQESRVSRAERLERKEKERREKTSLGRREEGGRSQRGKRESKEESEWGKTCAMVSIVRVVGSTASPNGKRSVFSRS